MNREREWEATFLYQINGVALPGAHKFMATGTEAKARARALSILSKKYANLMANTLELRPLS